jgi:choice-of-anchor A domain-containing protein
VGLGAQTATAPPAAAAEGDVNPFTSAGGFTVYAQRDAVVGNQELEGSLAAGRDLTVTDTAQWAVIHVAAGTADYTIPTVDGDPTRLLIGRFDPDESRNVGQVNITSRGATTPANVGALKTVDRDLGPYDTSARGEGWVRESEQGSQPPLIDATAQTYPADAEPPTGSNTSIFTERTGDTQDVVAGYVQAAQDATTEESAQCLAALTDPEGHDAHHVTVAEDDGDRKVLAPLAADRPNVVAYEDVAGAGLLQFSAGSATPGQQNPLIIRVPAGTTDVQGLRVDPQGQYSPYILWDLSAVTGAVTVQHTGERIDGSIYAPFADVTVDAAPLDGQVIGRDVTLLGGEVHSFLFASTVPCGEPRGTFEAAKELDGIAAGDLPDGTTFAVDWTATSPDGEVLGTGTLALPADGTPVRPQSVDGTTQTFPAGTVVTFDEQPPDDVPGWAWGAPSVAPDPLTVTAEGDAVASVTVTNTAERTEGTFEVTKTVTDGADDPATAPEGTTVTVGWTAAFPGGGTAQGTVDLVAGADGTFAPTSPVDGEGNRVTFPVGTEITLDEPATDAPPPGFAWGMLSWSPTSTFTIERADQVVTVDLTNLLVPEEAPTAFSVVKVLDLDEPVDPAPQFSLEYTFDPPGEPRESRTVEIGVGDPITVDTRLDGEPIPAGSTVWVREPEPSGDDGIAWEDPVLTVDGEPLTDPDEDGFYPVALVDGQTVALEVTNVGQVPAGSFTLAKELDGPAAEDVPEGLEFSVGWTATYPDGSTTSGSTSLPPDGAPVAPTDAAGDPIDFPAGTTVTFDEADLPDLPGWDWGEPTITPSELTVGDGETPQVTVTNAAAVEHGRFEVSKDLEGIDPGGVSADGFDVPWRATLPDGSTDEGVLRVPADGSAVGPDRDFPVGTTVRVTEEPPSDGVLPDGWTWAVPTWSPGSSLTIDEGAGTTAGTVTNSAVPTTTVRVEKLVDGTDLPDGTRFPVEYRVDDGPVQQDELVLGEPYVADEVPLGTTIELREADPPGVDGARWGTPRWAIDGQPLEPDDDGWVVIHANDERLNAVTLTNTARPTAPAPGPEPTVPGPGPELPQTGFGGGALPLLALGLLVLGVAVRLVARTLRA